MHQQLLVEDLNVGYTDINHRDLKEKGRYTALAQQRYLITLLIFRLQIYNSNRTASPRYTTLIKQRTPSNHRYHYS